MQVIDTRGLVFLVFVRSMRFGHTRVPIVHEAPALKFLVNGAPLNSRSAAGRVALVDETIPYRDRQEHPRGQAPTIMMSSFCATCSTTFAPITSRFSLKGKRPLKWSRRPCLNFLSSELVFVDRLTSRFRPTIALA